MHIAKCEKRNSKGAVAILAALTLFLVAWLCLPGNEALAQEQSFDAADAAALFGTKTGDPYTSVFLNQIFGELFPSVDGTETKTVFSSVIGYFNIIMLVIGGMMFFYNVTVGIMQSAHEGQVLGNRWSSLWAPIRVLFAVGLMVPVPGLYGYNLAQAGIGYIVKGSTNFASVIWSMTAEEVVTGKIAITTEPAKVDPSLFSTLFQNAACMAIINHQFAIAGGGAQAGYFEALASEDGTQTTTMSAIRKSDGSLVNRGVCGSFTTPELPAYIKNIDENPSVAGLPGEMRESITQKFIQAHSNALTAINERMIGSESSPGLVQSILPSAIDNGASPPDITGKIEEIVLDVNLKLSTAIDQIMTDAIGPADANNKRSGTKSREALLARIRGSEGCADGSDGAATKCYGEGWIGAGSWYMMLAQLNNEIASLTTANSTASTGSYMQSGAGDFSTGMRDLYLASGGESGWFVDENDRATNAGFAAIEEAQLWNQRLLDTYESATSGLAALGFPLSSDQLSNMNMSVVTADGGWNLLNRIPGFRNAMNKIMQGIIETSSPSNWGADPMIGITNIGKLLINLSAALIVVAFGAGALTMGVAGAILAPFIAMLVTAGGTLAFILPMMPFLMWILAVTGYFLLIVEAVVAVNLWALAHMRMDGDGISGEAGRMGWLMLLSLLMTPVLMIFGFLIGMTIFRVSSSLIDIGIKQAVAGIFGASIFVQLGAMLTFGILMVVVYIILLERSFSLVSEFPGRVLRWMGADAQLTRGEEDKMRLAAGAAMAGTYQMTGGLGRTAGAAGSRAGLDPNGGGQGPDGRPRGGAMYNALMKVRTRSSPGTKDDGGGPLAGG